MVTYGRVPPRSRRPERPAVGTRSLAARLHRRRRPGDDHSRAKERPGPSCPQAGYSLIGVTPPGQASEIRRRTCSSSRSFLHPHGTVQQGLRASRAREQGSPSCPPHARCRPARLCREPWDAGASGLHRRRFHRRHRPLQHAGAQRHGHRPADRRAAGRARHSGCRGRGGGAEIAHLLSRRGRGPCRSRRCRGCAPPVHANPVHRGCAATGARRGPRPFEARHHRFVRSKPRSAPEGDGHDPDRHGGSRDAVGSGFAESLRAARRQPDRLHVLFQRVNAKRLECFARRCRACVGWECWSIPQSPDAVRVPRRYGAPRRRSGSSFTCYEARATADIDAAFARWPRSGRGAGRHRSTVFVAEAARDLRPGDRREAADDRLCGMRPAEAGRSPMASVPGTMASCRPITSTGSFEGGTSGGDRRRACRRVFELIANPAAARRAGSSCRRIPGPGRRDRRMSPFHRTIVRFRMTGSPSSSCGSWSSPSRTAPTSCTSRSSRRATSPRRSTSSSRA